MNGVAMARIGLILWEIGATGSREVLRYLPGLWDIILRPKLTKKIKNLKNQTIDKFLYIPREALAGLMDIQST